jgi:hypothetical protein
MLRLPEWAAVEESRRNPGAPREQTDTTKVPCSRGLRRESGAFLRQPQWWTVFENSTAFERRDLMPSGVRLKTRLSSFRGRTFELKLKLKMSSRPLAAEVTTFFTESLILAQDERWRRA